MWQVPWRQERAKSGGNLMEINAHEIDFMRHVMGEAETVYAVGGTYRQHDQDYPDVTLVSLNYAGGAVGLLHSSNANTLGGYGGRVDCENGSIVFPKFWGEGGGLTVKIGEEDERFVSASSLERKISPVAQEIEAFALAAMRGEVPPVGAKDGRAATEIALAAYESIESGQPVVLPVDRSS